MGADDAASVVAPGDALAFETHGARRSALSAKRAAALWDDLPPVARLGPLGGSAARRQVPSASVQRALVLRRYRAKGGPDGGAIAKAHRAWRLLKARAAKDRLRRDGLPASAALVASIVRAEARRAKRESKGSRGGATVGRTIHEGFVWLQSVAALAIDADNGLADAQAEPPAAEVSSTRRHAGSLPVKVQLQLEELARAKEWSVARTISRALLVACVVHHVRLNDALNALVFTDDQDPLGVIRARTTVRSKDGLPLELYAPAEGWLGPFSWLAEHLREMAGRKHAVPRFAAAKAGKPSTGTRLLPGVISPAHARSSLRDLCAMAPLCMSGAEFDALQLTTHSFHGTGPDMARFMGISRGWHEEHARQLGHWLRDKSAAQADPRKVAGAPTRGLPDGAPCMRGAMSLRYTQGGGRRGERQEQLEVRARLVDALRVALERFGRPWTELPAGTADWDILLGEGPAAPGTVA